jgi:Leucine-rich repeat (LRR) protein
VWSSFERFVRTEEEYRRAVGFNSTGLRLSAEDGWWNTCIRKTRNEALRLLGKVQGGVRISEDDLVVGQHEHTVELKRLLGLPQQEPLARASAARETERILKEVGIVGIKGMGGLGKSTIAKKLYDDPDVREWFTGGLCWLEVGPNPSTEDICRFQTLLIKILCDLDVSFGSPSTGRAEIRRALQGKKRVLVCLDDVWENAAVAPIIVGVGDLKAGSRILKTFRVKQAVDGEIFNLDVLQEGPAWELFCWHAFGGDSPPEALANLAQQATKRCGGLPLALKVLGRQIATSEDKSESLASFLSLPASNDAMLACQTVIQSSYANLPTLNLFGVKDAFLLLAGLWPRTFDFLELQRAAENLGAAVYGEEVVEERQQLARKALDRLADRSLIGLEKKGGRIRVVVHDLLADFAEAVINDGQRAARRFFHQRAGMPKVQPVNNTWQHVRVSSGSIPVSCLTARSSKVVSLVIDEGASFSECGNVDEQSCKCRLLIMHGGQATSLKLLRVLQCLRLHETDLDPLPRNFEFFKSLNVLEIIDPLGSLKALPGKLGQLMGLTTLKLALNCDWITTLRVSSPTLNSDRRTTLPESLPFEKLTVLNLRGCRRIVALPQALGSLTTLEKLLLRGCKQLKALPESLGRWEKLRELDLSGCEELEALPQTILQHSVGLRELGLSHYSSLRELPEFGHLMAVESLDLSWCGALQALPESLGGSLVGLTELDPTGCSPLKTLPESVGQLTGLKELNLGGCKALTTLPESMGSLTRLTTVDVSCSALADLPNSIGNLTGMTELSLQRCFALTTLPESLKDLEQLTKLDLRYSRVLFEAVPQPLQQLTRLTVLRSIQFEEVLRQLGNLQGGIPEKDHLFLANLLESMADDYIRIVFDKNASQLLAGALRIRVSVQGQAHIDVTNVLTALADLLSRLDFSTKGWQLARARRPPQRALCKYELDVPAIPEHLACARCRACTECENVLHWAFPAEVDAALGKSVYLKERALEIARGRCHCLLKHQKSARS